MENHYPVFPLPPKHIDKDIAIFMEGTKGMKEMGDAVSAPSEL